MTINKQITATLLLLVATIIFFGIINVDTPIQDSLFNHLNNTWILNRNLEPYKFIFYDGIKKLLIFFALSLLATLIFFRKKDAVQKYKTGIKIVILSAIFVPLMVGGLKKYTNMPCPKNEVHYGGTMIRTAVWESYKEPYSNKPSIRCYPAGHASGGFALLSLFFLFKAKRNKILALTVALSIGWSMGIYKMLIGDHFLSHNIITMILAWLIILIISKFIRK